MKKDNRVIVVGSGLGGLAAACTLASRGYRVTVMEANSWLGGKAAVLERGGYRFDMGPTILTLPSVLRRIFADAGESLEEHLDLVRLDPQWRSFFVDGSTLDLAADTERMADQLDRFAPGAGSAEGYRRFMRWSERLHAISERHFFWRPVGGLRDMFDLRSGLTPSTLRDVLSMRMGATVSGALRSFVPEPRVSQMLDHFTQYVGSAPDASPAVLCGIAHMQTEEGVWYPLGGIGAVVRALAKLAATLGVELLTDTPVRRINVKDGVVRGVETADGLRRDAGAVVANADSVRTHRELLDEKVSRPFLARWSAEPACSGVVLYLGLNRRYEHLLHHNFVFSKSPKEEFEYIYRRGEPAPDPTCYVCAPARTDPAVAPPGGEALYVLVHTPYLRPHHNWAQLLPGYRRIIFDKLERAAGLRDLRRHICLEEVLTPEAIHRRYRVLAGAIYGLASHGRFLGAFKPSNRSPEVRGLYLAGGSAHPGPGMPMVLMSGWIAADSLDRDRAGQGDDPGSWPAMDAVLTGSPSGAGRELNQPCLGGKK